MSKSQLVLTQYSPAARKQTRTLYNGDCDVLMAYSEAVIIHKFSNFTTNNQHTKGLRLPAKTPHSPYTFAITCKHQSE
ncbi:MAG: hypothetical protein ABJL43_04000 [Maribacter dokdonensis]|uniref:hypothetical protein n=1 Tax=Maribacter dokdonensis TaxID=320912 RepID=UPI003297FAFA